MPKKRANGEGTITTDHSHPKSPWVYQWTHEGRRCKRRFATQAEAAAFQRSVQSAIHRGEYAAPDRMTVADWLTVYMRDVAPLAVAEATLDLEMGIVEDHLLPAVGKCRLQDPRLRDRLQAMITAESKKWSSTWVRRIKSVIHKALKEAVRRRYIVINPADDLVMPPEEQSHVEAFTRAQAQALTAHLPDTTNGRALRLILLTGMRVSEMCALRWQDVDEKALHVNHTISKEKLAPPKTKASRRPIPLTDAMRALLKQQRVEQAKQRLRAGSAWNDGDFIFATAVGGFADRHNVSRTLRSAEKRADVPAWGVHALRHTFATQCIQTGMNVRTLSVLLGHTNVAFTMKTYVHSDEEIEQAGMDVISNLFG